MGPPEIVVVVTEGLDGAAVPRWSRLLTEAADMHPRRLVVDLSACPTLDAGAVVLLLRTHRQMMRADGRLQLRRPTDRVRRILALARVGHVLEIEPLGVPG